MFRVEKPDGLNSYTSSPMPNIFPSLNRCDDKRLTAADRRPPTNAPRAPDRESELKKLRRAVGTFP